LSDAETSVASVKSINTAEMLDTMNKYANEVREHAKSLLGEEAQDMDANANPYSKRAHNTAGDIKKKARNVVEVPLDY